MEANEPDRPVEQSMLSGEFLALCAWCRRLRSQGRWYDVGGSLRADSFTHTICPDCASDLRSSGRSV